MTLKGGLRQLVERQLVERQLGDVNWSQRQLGATTISRNATLVAILKNQTTKNESLLLQGNNSENSENT